VPLPRRPDLAGRDEVLLESVAGEVEKIGSRAHAVMCDVGIEEDVRGLFRETIRVFGHLDLLFNNAGIAAPAITLEELSLESWSNVVATNLTGAFLCTREAFGLMKRQRPPGGGSLTTARSRRRFLGHTRLPIPRPSMRSRA
jgi:NAD(P)-dependent dehydrogenase (short-subunit alcohol dehydrogenase family)